VQLRNDTESDPAILRSHCGATARPELAVTFTAEMSLQKSLTEKQQKMYY